MKVTSRFTIAIQTMLCIACYSDKIKVTSNFIASSVNANPVVIRRVLGQLKKANLITTKAGIGGSSIAKDFSEITLLDIFIAVEADEKFLFSFQENPNCTCPVGKNIHTILDDHLLKIQVAMNNEMKKTTLKTLLAETLPYLQ